MKRINVRTWRGQRSRGIRTVNTTGFGGIVLVPTIFIALLLGAVLIACPEAGSSGGGGSQATVETITRANVITAKWQASAGASGYIVTVTDDQGEETLHKIESEKNKQEYTLDIALPEGTYKVRVSTQEKPDTAIATSTPTLVSTAATPPGKPSITKSEAVAEGISITWTAPAAGKAHNGDDATIKGYTIYWKKGREVSEQTNDGNKPVARTAGTVSKTTISVKDNKLLGNTEYAIIVVAENTAGLRGPASDLVLRSTVTQATAPLEVSGITTRLGKVANNTQEIIVEWDIPTAEQRGKDRKGVAATIESYTIYYRSKYLWNDAENKAQDAAGLTITHADITALKEPPNAQTDITTHTISKNDLKTTTGASPKYSHTFDAMTYSSYVFVIVARNNVKLDSPIGSSTNTLTTATGSEKPGTVEGIAATKGKADGTDKTNSITLTWTKLTNTGKTHKGEPAEIVQYAIYWQEGDTLDLSSRDVNITEPTEKDATRYTFSNLNKNTKYAFALRAKNNAGLQSEVSKTEVATTDDAAPELRTLLVSRTTVTAVFDAVLKTVDTSQFTVTDAGKTYGMSSAKIDAIDKGSVSLTLSTTLQMGKEVTVAIKANAVTSSTDRKNATSSKTATVMGAVYKAHVSTDNSAHRTKFSLGDYNDPELFQIGGLPGGSKAQYEITVSAGSASIYRLAKKQTTEVPSSGENKGSIYVGPAMEFTKWSAITDNSEVTITLTVYDEAGSRKLFSETVKPKKSPDGSIYSWRGLQNMQDKLDGTYTLENDITFPKSGEKGFVKFMSVGSEESSFTGTLNGNNKKVNNLYINHDVNNVGLFSVAKTKVAGTVVVKNLWLVNPKIESRNSNIGALVGHLYAGTAITNVHVQGGTVVSTNNGGNVGGLVGVAHPNVVITSGSSSAQVQGGDLVGGLVGYNLGATIIGYATGAVSGTSNVGGLVGSTGGIITGYATGAVSGSSNVGGLVGSNRIATVTGYATGTVSGTSNVGGLVGHTTSKSTTTGYALGYVIKTNAAATYVGPGIGRMPDSHSVGTFVGRTSEEAGKAAGAGDHVGVIATAGTTPPTTTSNGFRPQGIVIEGSGTNASPNLLYSKNQNSFYGFAFGTKTGEWTLGADDNWPILNFPSDFAVPTQEPRIPAKPTRQDPNDATKTLQFYE